METDALERVGWLRGMRASSQTPHGIPLLLSYQESKLAWLAELEVLVAAA